MAKNVVLSNGSRDVSRKSIKGKEKMAEDKVVEIEDQGLKQSYHMWMQTCAFGDDGLSLLSHALI